MEVSGCSPANSILLTPSSPLSSTLSCEKITLDVNFMNLQFYSPEVRFLAILQLSELAVAIKLSAI